MESLFISFDGVLLVILSWIAEEVVVWVNMNEFGALWVQRWTSDREVTASQVRLPLGQCCTATLGKLFALVCLCHQVV